jgi:DNA polymerase-3 subunit beta
MEFTVNKNDLVRELSLSQGVVEKKTTIPSLSHVLIEGKGGRIELTATDLELGVRSSCTAKVSKDGSVCVPAKKLLDYVRLLDDGDLAIKAQENHWIQITYKRSRTRMVGMSRESFPVLPSQPEKQAEIPCGVLGSMIARTVFAISSEESRYTLNGALLVVKPDSLSMVATDGYRLAHVERASSAGVASEVRALVPKKAMLEIQKLLAEAAPDATLEFAKSDTHLFFRVGHRLLASQQLSGHFPSYEAVIPKDNDKTVQVDRTEFTNVVRRVAQFADERTRAIRMSVSEPDQVKLSASSSDLGESEETLEAPYHGPTIDVGFNAQYLLDFLSTPGAAKVNIDLKDDQSAGLLRPVEEDGDNYRYVLMPMRI